MGWTVTAMAMAGMLSAPGVGQQANDAGRDQRARPAWAAAAGCEEVLARERRDGWIRLCLPGDPLVLRTSFAWTPAGRERPAAPGRREWAQRRGDRRLDDHGRLDDRGDDRRGDAEPGRRAGCETGVERACAATVTPEPVSLLLLGTGLAGIAGAGFRKRRRASSD